MNTCPGPVEPKVGCQLYLGSDDHIQDMQHEDFMRAGGLGFGIRLDVEDATMSMHLQLQHGMSYEEAGKVVRSETSTPQQVT